MTEQEVKNQTKGLTEEEIKLIAEETTISETQQKELDSHNISARYFNSYYGVFKIAIPLFLFFMAFKNLAVSCFLSVVYILTFQFMIKKKPVFSDYLELREYKENK